MSWFQNIADKVQSSLPTKLPEMNATAMLETLTLTTPELAQERRRMDAVEKRKERVRSMLAGLLPWETRDRERDILVDECRDCILNLSQTKRTFFGPYPLPPRTAKTTDDDDDKDTEEEEEPRPCQESLEMLAKLEPLPSLLGDFDFQAHVGLIEKILAVDENLVEMQSSLSGGGLRERIFWRNYFIHCANSRYEAGLDIDEIWSEPTEEERAAMEHSQRDLAKHDDHNKNAAEETITFDDAPDNDNNKPANTTEKEPPITHHDESTPPKKTTPKRSESDYEMVNDDTAIGNNEEEDVAIEADLDASLDDADYELDELEAEIARELQDD